MDYDAVSLYPNRNLNNILTKLRKLRKLKRLIYSYLCR